MTAREKAFFLNGIAFFGSLRPDSETEATVTLIQSLLLTMVADPLEVARVAPEIREALSGWDWSKKGQ